MTTSNFLSYLQQLLTMVDPENPYSIALAETALRSTVEMARLSNKTQGITLRIMISALTEFEYLVDHKKEYIGVPGDYIENERRRRRLQMALQPEC